MLPSSLRVRTIRCSFIALLLFFSFWVTADAQSAGSDTTPDAFSFPGVGSAELGSLQTSAAITVSGINAPSPISVAGGTYSVNSGPFIATAGFVNNGDSVQVQETAPNTFATSTVASLSIGSLTRSFKVTSRSADIKPDSFSFPLVSNVPPGSLQTSNEAVITGIEAPASVSVSNGSYNINGGPFTTAPGQVNLGDRIRAQIVASTSTSTQSKVTVSIGGISGSFVVTTSSSSTSDTTPDGFSFDPVTGAAPGSVQTSDPITVSGINTATPISITGGKFSINGGSYTSSSGSVSSGQTVTVQLTSSSSFSTTSNATLTIGGISATFTVTTASATDTAPDAFSFDPVIDVATGSTQTSNAITVSGISTAVPITITGGKYNINGGSYTSSNAGSVSNGQTVTVQLTSSSSFGTTSNATLTIGGVSATFTVTTVSANDPTPDAFSFDPVIDVATGSTQFSNTITVSGINAPASISISGGSANYSIGNGSYTSSSGTIVNGQTVTIRMTASSSYSKVTTTKLTIGGVVGTFSVTTVAAPDTGPDAFSFTPVTGAATSSTQTSNAITVSGISAAVPITITGGKYSINGGSYTSSSGNVSSGQTVIVQLTSSSSYSTTTSATLTIGGVTGAFSVTTVDAPNTTPDAFSFAPVTGATPSSTQISNPITVSGINAAVPITITGGKYSINGGSYTSSNAGSVSSGQTVTVQLIASSSFSTTTSATLTIGGVTGAFSVTTADAQNTTPDAFSFTPVTGAAKSSTQISNAITVSGISAAVPITITGGKYSINGGSYTSSSGNASSGQTVTVQLTASSSYSTTTSATLTIGGVSGSFSVTTADAPNTTPDSFSFTPVTGVAKSSVQTSNAITVSGINAAVPITITGGKYSINGGSYTSSSGNVSNGQTVTVQLTASSSYSTTTSATLTIGGVTGTFSVITVDAPDVTPDSFSFTPATGVNLSSTQISNAITVSGISAAVPITITGGKYSINGGSYTSSSGNVSSGQTVTVQLTASSSYSTTTSATLTIGGVTGTFNVTTISSSAIDTTPDAFSFTPVTGAAKSSTQISNTIAVSGINAAAPISISGGSYSINGGSYNSSASTIANGQTVTVRLTASSSYSTTTTATLTIGGVTGAFGVTTVAAPDTTPDSFSFAPVNGVPISSVQTSNAITVSGISAAAAISVSGGKYSINGGSYTTSSSTVSSGQTVTVQLTTSSSYSKTTAATLTIGGVAGAFSVTTGPAPDTTPDGFSFAPITGVPKSSVQTSNPITVSGISAPAAISVSGGKYSVNGGSYTTSSGTVANGQTVSLQLTASSSYNKVTTATLTIGGVPGAFSITTVAAPDTTPDSFSFTAVTGAALNSVQTSNTIVVSGINTAAPISISGGSYSINNGSYTTSSGSITSGQTVKLQLNAAATTVTTSKATLTIGGVTGAFSVTTAPPDPNTVPSGVLDFSHWKLTVPTGTGQGKATEISVAQLLAGYSSAYFYRSADGGVTFWCPLNGGTTGSDYPRSELREQLTPGNDDINWSVQGPSYLDATAAVIQVPATATDVVIGQIHGASDNGPLIKLLFDRDSSGNANLRAIVNSSPSSGASGTSYILATGIELNEQFTYNISVRNNILSMSANFGPVTNITIPSGFRNTPLYFKAGNYLQDNGSDGSKGSRVTFYSLLITH